MVPVLRANRGGWCSLQRHYDRSTKTGTAPVIFSFINVNLEFGFGSSLLSGGENPTSSREWSTIQISAAMVTPQ
jgi:hypothetical protein